MSSDTVLEARGLTVSFGPVVALSPVDLEIRRNQIVGVIGPNGAGKTTLIDALTGFVRARGEIRLGTRDISRMPPHRRARAGLSRTWQAAELFEDLSVRENLNVSSDHRSPAAVLGAVLRRQPPARQQADVVLGQLGLADLADVPPARLTEGQRKLVGVARALSAEPDVLLLDEPAAGLDSDESAELGAKITEMASEQTSVLLIDHDMSLVLGICDHLIVLDRGRVIAVGPPDAVRRDPAVIAAYLGTSGTTAGNSTGRGGSARD